MHRAMFGFAYIQCACINRTVCACVNKAVCTCINGTWCMWIFKIRLIFVDVNKGSAYVNVNSASRRVCINGACIVYMCYIVPIAYAFINRTCRMCIYTCKRCQLHVHVLKKL